MNELHIKQEWSAYDETADALEHSWPPEMSPSPKPSALRVRPQNNNGTQRKHKKRVNANKAPLAVPLNAQQPRGGVGLPRTPPGMRCAEIFVTNNARCWTFVCTFCNKTTRDIGDFICHIKEKHLSPSSIDNDDNDRLAGGGGEYSAAFGYRLGDEHYGQLEEQDYMDYGPYLDVNVHTEPPTAADAQDNFDRTASAALNYERKDGAGILAQVKRCSTSTPVSRKSANQAEENEVGVVIPVIQSARGQYKGDCSNDNEIKFEEEGEPEAAEEEADADDEFLLAPADSMMGSVGRAGSIASHHDQPDDSRQKIKRRQIRGTAYCALCDKTFQYYSLYRNHMIKHSNETPFKCNICQKGFKSKQAIRYHVNTHNRKKSLKCSLCPSASFHMESQFITHMLTHEDEDTFPCMVCGKLMRSDKERLRHMETHTSERPFRCQFCSKLFRLRHHLSNHMKMHRQYRCDNCRQEFMSSIQQRKPYTCARCVQGNTGDDRIINPLELFVAAMPSEQTAVYDDDAAEMVSNSEQGENEAASDSEPDDSERNDDGNESDMTDGGNDDDPAQKHNDDASDGETVTNELKRYTCDICHRTYSSVSGLNYHKKSHY